MKFLFLVFMIIVLLIIHEFGHYLAYKFYGIPAHLRKSLLAPGISPNKPVSVSKIQGVVIALSGFIFSTIIFVLPSILFYPLWKALMIGSVAGSAADLIWCLSIISSKEKKIDIR